MSALAAKLFDPRSPVARATVAVASNIRAQHEAKADPSRRPHLPRDPDFRIRRPIGAAWYRNQPPDCEFRSTELKTGDPDQWSRLKAL